MNIHPDTFYPNTRYTPFSYVVRKTLQRFTISTQAAHHLIALLPFLITSYIDDSYDMCLYLKLIIDIFSMYSSSYEHGATFHQPGG